MTHTRRAAGARKLRHCCYTRARAQAIGSCYESQPCPEPAVCTVSTPHGCPSLPPPAWQAGAATAATRMRKGRQDINISAEAVAEGWAAASEMELLLEQQQMDNRRLEALLAEALYQKRRVLWQYGTRVALYSGVREGPDAPPSYAQLSKQVRRMQKQLMNSGKHELAEAEAQTDLLGADLAVDQALPEDGPKQGKKKSHDSLVTAAFSRFLPSGKPKGDVKRITLRGLHRLISELFESLAEDEEEEESHSGKHDFMEALHDFLLKRYGLKTLAMKEMYSIVDALKRFKACEPQHAASRRILLFARFLGLSTDLCDPPEELKLYLRLWRRASATVGAFLPENESGVSPFNMQFLNAVLLDDKELSAEIQGKKMIALKLAMRTAGREEKCSNELKRVVKANTVLVADFDNLIEKVLRARYDNSEYELLFKAGDENGDGVLEVSEFKGIIAAVDPNMKQKEVLGMYKETLKLSGGEADAISPAAFAWVAKRYGARAHKVAAHACSPPYADAHRSRGAHPCADAAAPGSGVLRQPAALHSFFPALLRLGRSWRHAAEHLLASAQYLDRLPGVVADRRGAQPVATPGGVAAAAPTRGPCAALDTAGEASCLISPPSPFRWCSLCVSPTSSRAQSSGRSGKGWRRRWLRSKRRAFWTADQCCPLLTRASLTNHPPRVWCAQRVETLTFDDMGQVVRD